MVFAALAIGVVIGVAGVRIGDWLFDELKAD